MKRIALVSNSAWSIYNYRMGLINVLKNEKYEILVIAPYDNMAEILSKNLKYYNIKINPKNKNPLIEIKTLISFVFLYIKLKPDIVFHFTIKPNLYGSLAANLLGIKTINTVTGLGSVFMKNNIISKIIRMLYKLVFKKATFIFFQNKDDYNFFISNKLVDVKKCGVVQGSGVNIKMFSPTKKSVNDGFFRFLFIGRLLLEKGITEYIEAAKIIKLRYRNVVFQVIGKIEKSKNGKIPLKLIKNSRENNLIEYLGFKNDVRDFIKNADCIVLPSYYREGTPRSLLEAASMGKPIITTDNVGCRDVVVDGENGFLCKIKDSKDLAEKMEKMIKLSDKERLEMGKKGRYKIIREFDEKIVIDKYLKVIKDLIS